MSVLDSPAIKQATDQLNQLRARYYSLSERDRISIVVLAVFLGCVIFYYMIWSPFNDSLDLAKSKYQNKQELVAWLEANQIAARKVRSNPQAVGRGNQSMMSLVNNTSRQARLSLKRVEPKDDDVIRIWMDNASFDDVMAWLNDLGTRYGVSVVNITIEGQKDSGKVDASIILKG